MADPKPLPRAVEDVTNRVNVARTVLRRDPIASHEVRSILSAYDREIEPLVEAARRALEGMDTETWCNLDAALTRYDELRKEMGE